MGVCMGCSYGCLYRFLKERKITFVRSSGSWKVQLGRMDGDGTLHDVSLV